MCQFCGVLLVLALLPKLPVLASRIFSDRSDKGVETLDLAILTHKDMGRRSPHEHLIPKALSRTQELLDFAVARYPKIDPAISQTPEIRGSHRW